MYKNMLVAIDGSDNSKRAAEHASHIAFMNAESKVDLLYVLDNNRNRLDILPTIERDDLHIDREKGIIPIEEIFVLKNIDHKLIIKHGDPGPTIISFANAGNYDLVVIGSRGLNSFQEMILGSVSHKVAKRVHIPVLIVK